MADDNVVANLTLRVRRDDYGNIRWTVDDKHESATAGEALRKAGAELDMALAMVPGFRWGET